MTETPEIAAFGQDGERNDRADAWDLAQGLVIGSVASHCVSHVLDLVALPDQAARLSDHHSEHADGRRVDWQRQPDRRARRLVDIRQKTLLTHLATDDVPSGFDGTRTIRAMPRSSFTCYGSARR